MRNLLVKAAILAAGLAALGMGGLTGEIDPRDVPKPAINYKATITDRSDLVVEIEEFSLEGEVFLRGEIGVSQIAIPFDRIKNIEFYPIEDGKRVAAKATLADGETVEVKISRNLNIYGKASYGVFQVKAKNIKKAEIHGRK